MQHKTNWNRIKNMKDEEIDYSHTPELNDDFFKNSVTTIPEKFFGCCKLVGESPMPVDDMDQANCSSSN